MKQTTRKSKLILLRQFVDLETNEFTQTDAGGSVLWAKIMLKKTLDKHIDKCRKCGNLNMRSYTKSVPGWGNLNAHIFFIGESPCAHSMISQFPFAWKSGLILDIILRLSSLRRYDVFISNSCHCHIASKPKRTPTSKEIKRCSKYLHREITLVQPALIICLGNSAKEALLFNPPNPEPKRKIIYVKHPAAFLYNNTGLCEYILKLSLELDKHTK